MHLTNVVYGASPATIKNRMGKSMDFFSEKVIELGIDAGLGFISNRVCDKEFGRKYKKAAEDYLNRYWKKFSNASMDEEFDYEGLLEFFRRPDNIEKVKSAVSGTQAERKMARAALYNTAFEFAQARTTGARTQIRKIVSAIMDALRAMERNKVPFETKVLVADSIDEINCHSDKNTELVIDEIKSLRQALEVSENEAKKKYDNLRCAMLDNGGKPLGDGAILFNLEKIDREILGFADDSEIRFMKEQLGNRLKGTEEREEVITLFWAETKMTFQSGRRYGVMPMFQDTVREVCTASIYVDNVLGIVDRVHLARFYWDEYDIFHLHGDRYILRILMWKNTPVAVSMAYSFGELSDVHERLFYFDKVKPIVQAKRIRVIASGREKHDFCVDMTALDKEWRDHKELTEFWISQMNKIAEIEEYYNIHFDLPKKADEEEFGTIEILFDSIHRRCCRTLPGLPEKVVNDMKDQETIVFDEEMSIGYLDSLMDLQLFGYSFRPIDQYIIPCELYWNESNSCYETLNGGIPIGVEFALCVS